MASQTVFDDAPVSDRLRAARGMRVFPSPKLELYTMPLFLDAGECAALVELIERDRQPSTITDSNGDHYFRTSETCHFAPDAPPVVTLENRLAALNGIDPVLGEPMQGQRYDVGQEFKAHTDYFESNGRDWEANCAKAGNRTWTFMVYLNEPEAGGATRFKVVDKTFRPETGRLVCWNNRRADLSPNAASLHHALKVRKGLKYVITKWYRERPYA